MRRLTAVCLVILCLSGMVHVSAQEAAGSPAATAPLSPAVSTSVTASSQPAADGGNTQKAQDGNTLLLSFVGDCSIGDSFASRNTETGYHKTVEKNGYAWPFSLVSPLLYGDDLTVANLEVVLTSRKKHKDKSLPLLSDPKNVAVLQLSGIDAVNTVNNHCFDFFESGYQDTLQTLDGAGIEHFGTINAGLENQQDQLCIYEVKNIKIGLMGISYPQNSDLKRIKARIETLRAEGCQLVVVSLHWGRELHTEPSSGQYDYAKYIIDAGADVIYGHHPHILQPIHIYKGKPIFYSTGNFTFGIMGPADPDTGIFQLRYDIGEDGLTLENLTVIPCRANGRGDFRPYELTDPAERTAVFQKLRFKRDVKGMERLPESFLETGSADFPLIQ